MEDTISITKSEFIEFVTTGFPIDLTSLEKQEFYTAFEYYVNTDDNSFMAEQDLDGVRVYAGLSTEICFVKYDDEKILILTAFDEGDEDYSPEFSATECKTILAQACQGIIMFTKTYAIATGKFKIERNETEISTEKLLGDNDKYNPWIL